MWEVPLSGFSKNLADGLLASSEYLRERKKKLFTDPFSNPELANFSHVSLQS